MDGAGTAAQMHQLLLISWNVAGFRRTHDLIKSHYGSLDSFLARHQADIFCVQETRVNRQMLSSLAECKSLGAITENYESFWSFNELKGTSGGMNGVAVWVKKDLAKGANATQKVLEDDFDREGRCLMLDLGSLVVFNVYVPFLKKSADGARKLQFLQFLQKRVERVQSEGKMAIVCGDLNLTWRNSDVHQNGLYIQVVNNCIAGNPDLLIDSKVLETQTACEGWIRLGEAVKCLQSDLVLPCSEALKMISALPSQADRSCRLVRLSLEGADAVEKAAERDLWSLRSSRAPQEALEGLDPTQKILLQFGVAPDELAAHGRSPHSVNESECAELMVKWLGSLLDTFAECHGKAEQRFTHWVQQANMRYCNKGSRLDYILCDNKMPEAESQASLLSAIWSHLRRSFLVSDVALAGATEACDADSAEAAWNAATHYGRWHGAHQVQRTDGGGLSLQQDDMKLNDTQFRMPHTGILYTPPKYSDHVPVCACFRGLSLQPGVRWTETKATQPWTSQATLTALFSNKRQKI